MAMNFFRAQDRAKSQTFWLIFLFIIGTMLLSYFGAKIISFFLLVGNNNILKEYPHTLLITFMCFVGITFSVTLYKYFSLKQRGGISVAIALGGRLLDKKTMVARERRLLNIVEEMAIAANIPVPQTYILDNELNINAFAAGHTINDAVLGITLGSLTLLSRDELQAVVAHEFSHILNGDMRLNLRFTSLIFAFNFLSQAGYVFLGSLNNEAIASPLAKSKHNEVDKKSMIVALNFMVMAALFIIGSLGELWSRIMQAAVNRQREYLADASSVQFTRHANALASALKKIGGSETGSTIYASLTRSYSHFFFARADTGFIATHPPIEKRIRHIEPWWNGDFISPNYDELREIITLQNKQIAANTLENKEIKNPQLTTAIAVGIAITGQDSIPYIKPVSLLNTDVTDTEQAKAKLEAICQEPMDSCYLMFALLTDSIPSIRARQFQVLTKTDRVLDYYKTLSLVPKENYVTFVEKAILSLKNLSLAQYKKFKSTLMYFIQADKEISIKEWLLYQLITHQLDSYFYPKTTKVNHFYNSLDKLKDEIAIILSAIAYLSDTPETQKKIFSSAANLMALYTINLSSQKPASNELTASLHTLQSAPPRIRERFLLNLADALERNKDIMPSESTFFRVLSLCLDYPFSLMNRK